MTRLDSPACTGVRKAEGAGHTQIVPLPDRKTDAGLDDRLPRHTRGLISTPLGFQNFCIFSVSLIGFASNSVNCTFAI